MPQLIATNNPLFDDLEVSVVILVDYRALVEILCLTRPAMRRTLPANNIPVLMTFPPLKIEN
jgi:hypothetical protein